MKIGVDPEVFIVNESARPINAAKVLPSSSENPLKKNGINFYHDNVLAEFNFQPVKTEMDFLKKLTEAVKALKTIIDPYKISLQAYAELDKSEMTLPNSRRINCNPDFDAYTFTENTFPKQYVLKTNYRSAGGHFHIGGEKDDAICHPFMKPIFVFMLDLFLGIPSVVLDNNAFAFRRRKMFGRAGCHRDKPYGLEYRVLSSFWLRSPSTASLMYKIIEFVFEGMNDNLYKKFWNFYPERLKTENPETAFECWGYDHLAVNEAINSNDVITAKRFCNFISNFMPSELAEFMNEEMKTTYDNNVTFYW